jgi:hypothetical protein
MRPAGQIVQKLKQSGFRHMKRELNRLLAAKPQNCLNNTQVKTSTGTVGVCKLDCKTCDSVVHDRVEGCPSFALTHSPEALKASLKEFFRTASIEEIFVRFPDMATLLWALDDSEHAERGRLIPDASPTTSLWGVDLWVDTQEELEVLTEIGRVYEEERTLLASLGRALAVEPPGLPAAVETLQESLQALQREAAEADTEAGQALLQKEAAETRAKVAEARAEAAEQRLRETPAVVATIDPPAPSGWFSWRWPWQR